MNTWNEYGKWVTKGDNKALAEARQQLIASCKAHGLIIVKDLPNEIKGNKERPVVAIKDRGINMTNDYKKIKAYLVQELKDVKAKLKRMKMKDAVSDWYACKEDAKRLFKMGFTIAEALDSINRKWYGIMSPSDQKAVVLSAAKDMGINDAINVAKTTADSFDGLYDSAFEDEIKKLEKALNEDSAIKDYKIELMINGKKIGIVNASSPSEAVNRYEREHPELKGKVDGILVVDAVYKILKDSISYDKAEAERLFGLGYSAREVAMKIKEYQLSDNHSEQIDLIKRLENHRNEFFKEMMAKKRAGRI